MKTSEVTPLAGSVAVSAATAASSFTQSNQNTLQELRDSATQLFTKQNADQAVDYLQDQSQRLSNTVSEGSLSMRLLAFLGGIAMVVLGVMNFLDKLLRLQLIWFLIEFYTILLGLLAIVLEGNFAFSAGFERKLRKYALFLDFVWGRGFIYFVAGTLEMAVWRPLNVAIGFYMCVVAATYIFMGYQSAKKLSALRRALYTEEELLEKFQNADIEQRGTLNFDQFKLLLNSFNLDLTTPEAETTFREVERSADGRISFDEFKDWWGSWSLDPTQNAQVTTNV